MDANPCARVIPPKLVQPDIEFLDEKQIAALLAALHDAPKQLSVIVQIALFTGARRGEICGLRWSDLNFDTELMTINRNLSYIAHKGMIFDYPKTKKSLRCFTMSGDCIELLKDYKRFQAQERLKMGTYWKQKIVIEGGKRVKNDLLFTRADGSPIDPSSVSAWFPEFLREHNLPPCRFHSLRHPYVKHTTKKYNSEKQKTQATKMDLITWVFCFLCHQLFKEVMDLVNNLNAVVGKDTHLFNQQIGQLGG